MPESTVPFETPIYSICIAYYQAGENKKASELAQKLFTLFENDLRYYNRLPGHHKAAYGSEIRRAKEIMMSLMQVARANGEQALSKDFEQRLPAVISADEMQGYGRPQPVQK